MDIQSLQNMLDIIRAVSGSKDNSTTLDVIRGWLGKGADDAAILRVAGHIQEQAAIAEAVIGNSQLRSEAKAGINQAIAGVKKTFSIGALGTPWRGNLGNVTASIASLVMLLEMTGAQSTREIPNDAPDLINEIKEMMETLDNPEIDPAVRDVAKRHMQILSTLLQHIPIFGVEAALVSYFELLTKIRRADIGTTEASRNALDPAWKKIETWGKRIGAIDKIWNAGARLLQNADKVQSLLTYLPG